jgi:hypothetical protein
VRSRAFLPKYVALVLTACFTVGAYCTNAFPRYSHSNTPDTHSFLRFGQHLALADFDGDHRIDRATLDSTGRRKRIDIRFSQTKPSTVLYFDTGTEDGGSLFANDIDNDGDNDLIWSDLVHPDNVVVWLDDGTGRFERGKPDHLANEFVLNGGPALLLAEIPHQDLISCQRHDPLSIPRNELAHYSRPSVSRYESTQPPPRKGLLLTHSERGPPPINS